jgi:hypothetical protein
VGGVFVATIQEQILAEVQTANLRLANLEVLTAKIEVRSRNHDRQLATIEKELWGNPHGLKVRLQSLENCKQNLKDSRVFWRGVLQKVLAYGIIALAAYALWLYKNSGDAGNDKKTNQPAAVEVRR